MMLKFRPINKIYSLYPKRNLYSRSRFQYPANTLIVEEPIRSESSINNNSIFSANDNNLQTHVYSDHLESSIIEKLYRMKIDKSQEKNDDLSIIFHSSSAQSKLSEIDEFILRKSNSMVESTTHNMDYLNQLIGVQHKSLKDNKVYQYKYPLLTQRDSISEIRLLKQFIFRITKDNVLNSNDRIKNFLVNRIINCPENYDLLRQHEDIKYLIMNFFMKKYKPSDLLIIDKIVNMSDAYDTKFLNLILKSSVSRVRSADDKLLTINKMLTMFIENKLNLNKATVYLIFQHLNECGRTSSGRLTEFLEDYMKTEGIIDNKYITNVIYEKLSRHYVLYNKATNSDFKDSIERKIMGLICIIPKFKNIELDKLSLKTMRKLYAVSKFNNEFSFNKLLKMHLSENNWKFGWDSISTYRLLRTDAFSGYTRNMLLRRYPSLKYSNFGKSFKKSKHILATLWINEICLHSVRIENWELLIRLVNEFNEVNHNVYSKALKSFLTFDAEKSFLTSTDYLIIVKYILHKSLSTKLGPFKRNDVIFKALQCKMDSLFGTNFNEYNYSLWQQKVNSARAEYDKESKIDSKLFDKCFIRESTYESTFLVEDTNAEEEENSSSRSELIGNLLSPDLSRITEFEGKLFDKLSALKVLDTEEKVLNEHSKYSDFWDSRGINFDDVKHNYHLGIINSSYKHGEIQWDPMSHAVHEHYDADFEAMPDSEMISKVNQIYDLDHQGLIDIFNKNPKYQILQRSKDGVYKTLNRNLSLNNVLPTDWLTFVLIQTHREWLTNSILQPDKHKEVTNTA